MAGQWGFVGLTGLVLFLFGLVSYGLTRQFDAWTAIHLTGGGVLLAIAIAFNFAGFRRTMTARRTRERARAGVGTAVFVGLLLALNTLAVWHPWRYDATENRIHTLSEQTTSVLKGLDRPVEVLAFLSPSDPRRSDLEALLGRFQAASSLFKWRLVDAEREPQTAEKYGVRRLGVVVAEAGVDTARTEGEEAGVSEGAITNLLIKLTRGGPKTIYALEGHGEPSVRDLSQPGGLGLLADALRQENFSVESLLLSAKPAVPDDAALLLILGPQKDLMAHELEQLEAYRARGGRVLVALDPGASGGLQPWLTSHGVTLGDDMIVDQVEVPFVGARLGVDPIVSTFPDHPITRGFDQRIVLMEARSVAAGPRGEGSGPQAQVVAETSSASWAESDWRAMMQSGRVQQDDADLPGPIPIAVAVTEGSSPASRLLALGDSGLAENANLDVYFNREFLLNAVQWLVGGEALIGERPRGLRPSRLDMTVADIRGLFRLGVLLLPETLLIVGLAIWWRRRSL